MPAIEEDEDVNDVMERDFTTETFSEGEEDDEFSMEGLDDMDLDDPLE